MQILLSVIASICLLYLITVFLVSPASKKHDDIGVLTGKYIAHRGLHNQEQGIPENSLTAFKASLKAGYPIEIDLHLTKDNEVIVFHDHTVNRMTGGDGRVEEMTLTEIKTLRLSGTDESIPTLRECLDTVDGEVPLLIEFKMDRGNTESLCRKADEILSDYHGKYLIQSFYPQIVRWYKKNRKNVCRGQLAQSFHKKGFAKFLLGNMVLNFLGRPHFISYKHKNARSPMFRFAIWLGATPIGWTFGSKEQIAQNKKYFSAWIFEQFDPKHS